jgi:hypothetical protein
MKAGEWFSGELGAGWVVVLDLLLGKDNTWGLVQPRSRSCIPAAKPTVKY